MYLHPQSSSFSCSYSWCIYCKPICCRPSWRGSELRNIFHPAASLPGVTISTPISLSACRQAKWWEGNWKGESKVQRDLWQKKQRGKEEGTKKGRWGRKKCGEGRLTIGRLWLYRIARVGMLVWVASAYVEQVSPLTDRTKQGTDLLLLVSERPPRWIGGQNTEQTCTCRVRVCVCASSKHTVWIHERAESPSPLQALVKWWCYNMITHTMRSVFPKQCLPRLFPG